MNCMLHIESMKKCLWIVKWLGEHPNILESEWKLHTLMACTISYAVSLPQNEPQSYFKTVKWFRQQSRAHIPEAIQGA